MNAEIAIEANLLRDITDQARQRGWNDVLAQPTFSSWAVVHKPDLVLSFNHYPLAVVEVKQGSHGALFAAALVQAHRYAAEMELPFAIATDGKTWHLQAAGKTEIMSRHEIPSPEELWRLLGREWTLADPRLHPPLPDTETGQRLHQILAPNAL